MGSEKFCLKWNDFENNISLAFRELRDDKDFFDVTLACANEQIQAHKVILSACSPFFRDILRRNAHPAPLLYLKGVKYTDLQSVLNFMYHGEVNVAQEDLNSFLAVAEDLKIKGLTQNQSGNQNSKKEVSKNPDQRPSLSLPDKEITHPTSKRLRPKLTIPTFSNQTDNDIQEVVSIKSEPREGPVEAPIPSIQSVYQSQQHHSNTLAQADDQVLAYPEDNYEDYGQYADEQGEMAAQQTNAGVQGTEGDMLMYFPTPQPNTKTGRRSKFKKQLQLFK